MVHEKDEIARRGLQTRVLGDNGPLRNRMGKDPAPVLRRNRRRVVFGAVVHDDDLETAPLPEQAVKGFPDILRSVPDGHDDGNEWVHGGQVFEAFRSRFRIKSIEMLGLCRVRYSA